MDIGSRQRVIVVERLGAELEPATAVGEEFVPAPARWEHRLDEGVTIDGDADPSSGR